MFNKLKNNFKVVATRFWKDESAQGATEYILLLVVVVGVAMTFKDAIMGPIEGKIEQVKGFIMNFAPR